MLVTESTKQKQYQSNLTVAADGYKITQWMQRPAGMTYAAEYGEPRVGGQFRNIVVTGLQMIIKEYLLKPITQADIEEGEQLTLETFGYKEYFPREIWEKVLELGHLPIHIKALPEGSIVPEGTACFTIEVTEEWFAPMISHFEDILMWMWYPSAVATRAAHVKARLKPYFVDSVDDDAVEASLDFAVNEFGLRSAMGGELSAAMGGAGFLHIFKGTDNLPAARAIELYYDTKGIAGSVMASEHSTATPYGKGQGELRYLLHMLDIVPDDALVSIVIDSYDPDNFMKNIVSHPLVVERINSRTGRTVFRPDSNDPIKNMIKYLPMLSELFGSYVNKKGYRVLLNNVGLIQGDGMNEKTIPSIYNAVLEKGWSASNIVTGAGTGMLVSDMTRDTQRWAIKMHKATIDGVFVNVCKKPQSDLTKSSKEGDLKTIKTESGAYKTILRKDVGDEAFFAAKDELNTVLLNGYMPNQVPFVETRKSLYDNLHLLGIKQR